MRSVFFAGALSANFFSVGATLNLQASNYAQSNLIDPQFNQTTCVKELNKVISPDLIAKDTTGTAVSFV